MKTFSKANPPSVGTFIKIELIFISKCCGSSLVGYSAGFDEKYLFISSKQNGVRERQIGWNAITEINEIIQGEICIEI